MELKKHTTIISTIITSMPKSEESCRTVTSTGCQYKKISEFLYNQIRSEKGIKNLEAPSFPSYEKAERKVVFRDLAYLAFQSKAKGL